MPGAAVRDRAETAPPAEPKRAEWQALAPLSLGRPKSASDPKADAADIVQPGETVWLTEDESCGFLTRHGVPVIRPAKQQNQPAPRITARQVFGPKGRPTAAQFGARPDPKGASSVTLNPAHPENHPEANDPQVDLSIDPDAAKDK
jgi:hypothetical protein